ncbi:MAG: hypothetical protein ABSG63_19190 [Spirochaetia bacterium]|jgi:hypothetical protein
MRRDSAHDGSTSLVALTMLILMATVTAGGALILRVAFTYTSHSSERAELRRALRREGERIVGLLARDPTPDADSPMDPIWAQIAAPEMPGAIITLQDVSSQVNANWARKDLFEKTALRELLRAGSSAAQLQQRREDKGISTDIAAEYADLVNEEALPRYFTGYGYANLNVTDEFALRKLYAVRMDDIAGAEIFHTRLQAALIQRKMLKRTDLREFLGLEYAQLFPLMNVEPVLNVHFVEPLILNALLSHPDLKIPKPSQAANAVLSSRDMAEMTSERLKLLVGVGEENRIFQYLGVITWFWRIAVTSGSTRLELIVARLPSTDDSNPRFLIVEERYSA